MPGKDHVILEIQRTHESAQFRKIAFHAAPGPDQDETRPAVDGAVVAGEQPDHIVLPLAHLYKPMWEYDAATLARDLSAHLLYGATTAVVFRIESAPTG